MNANTTWNVVWADALDAIQLDVDRAEALLAAVHAGSDLPASEDVLTARWDPPRGLGPLPLPLVRRAEALLARQQEVARRLAEATHTNRLHARAAVALREKPAAVPVYLDVAL